MSKELNFDLLKQNIECEIEKKGLKSLCYVLFDE